MSKLPDQQVSELRAFVQILKASPDILHTPQLAFFKEYIESLGGKAPPLFGGEKKPEPKPAPPTSEPEPKVNEAEEELVESDIELDMEGVIGMYLTRDCTNQFPIMKNLILKLSFLFNYFNIK